MDTTLTGRLRSSAYHELSTPGYERQRVRFGLIEEMEGRRVIRSVGADDLGGAGTVVNQYITVNVEDRSPAAIAHAVEMAGLQLGEQLALEGI